MFPFKRKKKAEPQQPKTRSMFSTNSDRFTDRKREPTLMDWEQPTVGGVTQDANGDGTAPHFKNMQFGIPEAQASWYLSQTFIGYSMCALIAKHWLVDKAISMPARDALRQGYRIDGEGDDLKQLEDKRRKLHINKIMKEYIKTGREFGGAAALFVVESTDPAYYEKPFNADGIMPGQYKGIKVIDPNWMQPELLPGDIKNPDSLNFYVPTFWRVGNKLIHKSHFCFYIPHPVSNIAKHTYRFFGVSVPERIYERVYASERTANEAPQLAMTKRLITLGIENIGDADRDTIEQNIAYFAQMRDNYGVNIGDKEDQFQQFDTALGDLDNVIMTQYQLVAAGACVPGTKLLGTTPKGFNSTGEYEESVYREELESLQTNDLDPLLDRHLELTIKNEQLDASDVEVVWAALDSPTAKEYADTQLAKAQASQIYHGTGAIDGEDIRKQLSEDRESDYYGLEMNEVDISGWMNNETNEEASEVGGESTESQTGGQTASLPGVSGPTV